MEEFNSNNNSTYIRNKFGLDYNLSKLVDPFISYELFFRLNDKNEFRAWRITAGLDWRLTKRIDLTTFYRFQKEMGVKKTDAEHVLGLFLTYGTKIKKKKAETK